MFKPDSTSIMSVPLCYLQHSRYFNFMTLCLAKFPHSLRLHYTMQLQASLRVGSLSPSCNLQCSNTEFLLLYYPSRLQFGGRQSFPIFIFIFIFFHTCTRHTSHYMSSYLFPLHTLYKLNYAGRYSLESKFFSTYIGATHGSITLTLTFM